MWGGRTQVQTWRSTDNALEITAACYNDCLLTLDEMGEVDPRIVGNIAYMITNGVGKGRAHARERLRWRLLLLSSGELTLADHMSEGGKRIRAGQMIRIVDLLADANQKLGVFENLHGLDNGAALADLLFNNAGRYYGTASRAFLEKLTEDSAQSVRQVRALMERFKADVLPQQEPVDGQVRRVAERFALIAAAGELATAFGITNWAEDEAMRSVKRCFEDWLDLRQSTGSLEEQAALEQIRAALLRYEAKFEPWPRPGHSSAIRHANRFGWIRTGRLGSESMPCFVILRTAFEQDLCKGMNHNIAAKLLQEKGLLVPSPADKHGKRKNTRPMRLPNGQSSRVYILPVDVLNEAATIDADRFLRTRLEFSRDGEADINEDA